ncbi:hypothetical protein J437_LFUL014036, partial [Ladona fulva]
MEIMRLLPRIVSLLNSASKFRSKTLRYKSTIFALSSGYGKCGVSVIRVSGPEASASLFGIAGMKKFPTPRQANLRKIKNHLTNEILDYGIVIWFPGKCVASCPKSFTGEDVCELHVHGGFAVVTSVLETLGKLNDYRPADPGEFTKRAFYAGKLDLLEVEGLADLIQAETEYQRKQALYQMEGSLSKVYMVWRQTLLKCVAHVEAYIDFSEDENIEDDILEQNEKVIQTLVLDLKRHLADGRRGERLRDGVKVAIIGEPNVGKSSLLNLLCRQPAAIVSSIPGTTRDIVERALNIQGFPVILSDTAGLRVDTQDVVELEGVQRARKCVSLADLVLLVVDSKKFYEDIKNEKLSYEDYVKCYAEQLKISDVIFETGLKSNRKLADVGVKSKFSLKENCLLIFNKTDLLKDELELKLLERKFSNVCTISCENNSGIPNMMDSLKRKLTTLCANPSRESPSITQSRHRYHLQDCLHSMETYLNMYKESAQNCDVVLMTECLRQAMRHLGKITGHVSTEDILDVIFSDFCIGAHTFVQDIPYQNVEMFLS